jgi:hypothetical protein
VVDGSISAHTEVCTPHGGCSKQAVSFLWVYRLVFISYKFNLMGQMAAGGKVAEEVQMGV